MSGAQAIHPQCGLVTKSARGLGRAVVACILLVVASFSSMAQDPQPVQTAQTTAPAAQSTQTTASAAQPQPTSDAAALAKARRDAQNPIANMISLPIQENWNFDIGPADRVQNVLFLQPVIPIKLGEHWNLITRWVTPIIYQPYAVPIPQPSGPPVMLQTGAYGLGDMEPQFFFSPKTESKVTWGVGPMFLVPTATQSLLGQGKFGMGVDFVALAQPHFGTVGVLVNNIWSVAGHQNKPDVNQFYIQPFFNYNLHHAWYLTLTTSGITANWEQTNGNRWVVPIGGGPGRVWQLGHQAVNVQTFFFGNVAHPPGASPWSFRLNFTFLFPKPR